MVVGIIVAGGKGARMKGMIKKQYLALGGRPVLCHSLQIFDRCHGIDSIILVVPEDDISYCRQQILPPMNLNKAVHLVPGGRERQASVYCGLCEIEKRADTFNNACDTVVIHDGVRPFVTPQQIDACIDIAITDKACILGIPVSDTLKLGNASNIIRKTIERDHLWLAQTPQAFQYDLILKAHQRARQIGYHSTDDASLVEQLGEEVKILPGSRYNIKITSREDLDICEAIMMATKML